MEDNGTGKETTLDLNKVMEEGRQRFEGELSEAAQEEQTPESESEKKTSPPEEEQGETQKTEEGEQPPDETLPEKKQDQPGEAQPKAKRFKGHDEAEEGYRNLRVKTTRLEQENKTLKDQLNKEKIAEERAQRAQEESKKFRDFTKERTKTTLTAIDQLDPEEEGYQEKVADIWADHHTALRQYDLEHREEAHAAPPTETEGGDDPWAYVLNKAKEAEIDPTDDYFIRVCESAPKETEDGKPMTLDDQIVWAINKTKTYHAAHRKSYQTSLEEEARKKGRKNQEENLSLERGAEGRPSKGKVKKGPISMDTAIGVVMEERRL